MGQLNYGMSLWPEPLLNRVLDKRNMISFVMHKYAYMVRDAINEWWRLFYHLFYSSDAEQMNGAQHVVTLEQSVRAGVCPCSRWLELKIIRCCKMRVMQ